MNLQRPQPKEDSETIDILNSRLHAIAEKANKHKELFLNSSIEKENIEKRLRLQIENEKIYAISKFAKDLVDVSDNLERALKIANQSSNEDSLEDFFKGIEMTRDNMNQIFLSHKIIEFLPKIGEKFDEKLHETSDGLESGNISEIIVSGYILDKEILRKAKVKVMK